MGVKRSRQKFNASIRAQNGLSSLCGSSLYSASQGENEQNLTLMKLLAKCHNEERTQQGIGRKIPAGLYQKPMAA